VKRFAYICADPGIPVPGTKGSSIHVASVCKAFVQCGIEGTVHAQRPTGPRVAGVPVVALNTESLSSPASASEREARLFLGGYRAHSSIPADCDFIYERYSLWHAAGLVRARELGVPFILEVNSPLPDEAQRYRDLANRDLANGLARLLMREADGVVCVSSAVAEWVTELRGTDSGVWLVPNGVDAEIFSPSRALPRSAWPPEGAPLVAFAGSFRPWHGVDDLFQAFRKLIQGPRPEVHLLCVGDGPLRGLLEEQVRGAGLVERVRLTGAVPQAEVARELCRADVAVAPYPAIESFYFSPLKVFEFMALGLPVVAADVPGMRDLVPQGERGVLYEPGNIDALADSIASLLRDEDQARRLGSSGREWVLATATWKHRVDLILSRIDEIRSYGHRAAEIAT